MTGPATIGRSSYGVKLGVPIRTRTALSGQGPTGLQSFGRPKPARACNSLSPNDGAATPVERFALCKGRPAHRPQGEPYSHPIRTDRELGLSRRASRGTAAFLVVKGDSGDRRFLPAFRIARRVRDDRAVSLDTLCRARRRSPEPSTASQG